MKQLFLIVFITCFQSAFGQDDFLSVYAKINRMRERHTSFNKTRQIGIQETLKESRKDTAVARAILREAFAQNKKFVSDSIIPLAGKVVNITFPDISFTDAANKNYSISDFAGKEIIVNYNYLYCQLCLNRIDSTQALLKGRKVQLLVLFSDLYLKETEDLKNYGENVLIGFINEDTEDLISLSLGDNSMYYLNENRQIEFFDRIDLEQYDYAWNNFLKTYTK